MNGGTASRTQILPSSGPFTVSAQIKCSDTGLTKVAVGSADTFWIGKGSDNKATLHYGAAGTEITINSTVTVTDSAWHHVEWDYDPATGSKFFVDGNLAGSNATTMVTAGATFASPFGVREFAGLAGTTYDWTGEVDEVAVWSNVQHTSAFTPPSSATSNGSSGLIALYHLNGNMTDSAGVIYDRVDTTDTVAAQNIMVLVPNASATTPYNSANPTPVILYTHGLGEDQTGLLTETVKQACVLALLNAGYILVSSNARGNDFGTQAAVDDYAAAAKYVRDNYNVSGVAIWAQSMGGLTGLMAVTQNKIPGLVGLLATYPICSLSANYTTAGGTNYSSYINTCFGITGSGIATYANKTYGNDPILKPASAFRHLPMRFYASASDTVVLKSVHTDVMQAIVAGSCRESDIVVCSGTHGDSSHFDPTSYLAFFARCFATPVATSGMLGGVKPTTTKTATVTLQSKAGALRANLTGLNWRWSDTQGVVIDSGTGETTDASGVFSVTVHTALAAAGIGHLDIDNSTGVIDTTYFAFSGPVAVA